MVFWRKFWDWKAPQKSLKWLKKLHIQKFIQEIYQPIKVSRSVLIMWYFCIISVKKSWEHDRVSTFTKSEHIFLKIEQHEYDTILILFLGAMQIFQACKTRIIWYSLFYVHINCALTDTRDRTTGELHFCLFFIARINYYFYTRSSSHHSHSQLKKRST